MDQTKRLSDANEATRFLNVSRSHLDALVRAGLPYHDATLPGRKRRRLRFDLEEVKAWLAGRRCAA
jgi:predicted DNA-binding transcriptional regulator AlpA